MMPAELRRMNTQPAWAGSRERIGKAAGWEGVAPLSRHPIAFGAIVAFSVLYYYRPEDFIRPLAYIPMAKIAAIISVLPVLFGMMSGTSMKVPRTIKILWALTVQMVICIPFALWPGGAYQNVIGMFAKGVVVATVISLAVVNLKELRRLLWIQASAVGLVTFFSIALRHYGEAGRLQGIQEGILENPNDLAINIAISFPLALAFMLAGRGFKKFIWALCLAFMCLGVVLTASRSGLLALVLSIMVCVWEYGVKGKRRNLIVATIIASLLGSAIALSSSHYRARVESIFLGNVEGSGDKNSREARKELLKKSVVVALTHPLVGVGPGCFPLVDEGWRVAHNAFTELAAEAGIMALVLFLWAMGTAFKNIAVARNSVEYETNEEFRLFTQALWAGLVAYLAGSFFASTEYNLYPYFMLAYTCVAVRIAGQPQAETEKAANSPPLRQGRV